MATDANPNPDAKDHILSEFGITDVADVNDLSDLAIVEEQVQQLRYLYSTAIGDLTASGTVLQWINDFYTNHSDLVFNGPTTVAGPIEDWRSHITSHQGATDIPEHSGGHGGTDISSPSGTPLVLPAKYHEKGGIYKQLCQQCSESIGHFWCGLPARQERDAAKAHGTPVAQRNSAETCGGGRCGVCGLRGGLG